MNKTLLFFFLFILLFLFLYRVSPFFTEMTGAPPYDFSATDNVSQSQEDELLSNWVRPEGPAKVALQVGHWKNEEVPEELERLRGNTGATGGGKAEWEVNYLIAQETAKLLKEKGITVELLPATVPKNYWADIFLAIHADGNLDTSKSGFKAATPRRDMTGKGQKLLSLIESSYAKTTGLSLDPNVTRNMRGYYAFSWWRYEHAVHPMTTALILETGFLTSPSDRQIIVNQPELSAEAIADALLAFLREEQLL